MAYAVSLLAVVELPREIVPQGSVLAAIGVGALNL